MQNMNHGNYGKLLDVNLSSGEIKDYEIPKDYLQNFLGGKGLAARLLWDLLPADGSADPLGPENPLIFLTGPLVGLNVMGSARYVVMTKSPLSKFVAEAYGGGFFPYALKSTGYDGIIFRGKSVKPVYLNLVDEKKELVDASDLWGKGVFEVHDGFVSEYGKNLRTAIIGPAGENKVRYAAIINDRNRAAARGGVGAVMGSKNLKAIIAKGKLKPNIADNETFKEANETYRHGLVKEMKIKDTFGVYGTSGGVGYLNKTNTLPTKNFSKGQFEGHETLTGKYMEESGLLVGRDTCSACSTFCKRKIEGEFKGQKLTQDGSSLEYETIAAFGSMILNSDLRLNGLANQLCNDLGLDTISTGGSLAFAMEANENGHGEKLGVNLEWNNADQVIEAINKISYREDYGDTLAEGVMRMAEKIDDQSYAIHTKGMEIAYHEPRGKVGLGLSYAVSPRGGSHMEGFHDTMFMRENASPKLGAIQAMSRFDHMNKAPLVVTIENATSFTNSLIMCAFDVAKTGKYYNLDYLSKLTQAATGYNIDHNEMLKIGDRAYNMLRMVAVREGCTSNDDDLPGRFKNETLDYGEDGENAITQDKLDYMIKEYYEFRKWDNDGKPSDELIAELNLPNWN
ncbi:MAG: Tungsten-containing aldehyde ferredoxin oxidoreductase [Candidatus Heimdallarchaeota archaeon LC_2]|nr:MAG: Tungsten-containing aldehyde ferredoxin oxidoreductase [Candidatus Heimdallarchaeota archaeon LC_2]